MKRKSIKTAILIPSLTVLNVGIAIMVTVVIMLSSNTAKDMTQQLMNARVDEHANGFLLYNEEVYSALRASVLIISNYIDPESTREVSDPRGEVVKILSDVLLSNDKICAMWTCWKPDAFDGKDSYYAGTSFYDETGRFVPYVYRNGSSVDYEALADYDDPVNGEYYQVAQNTGKPYVTDPYIYNINGVETYMISFAVPIYKDGIVVGVVGADVNLKDLVSLMNSGRILDDGYILVLSPKGYLTTNQNQSLLLKHYDTSWMKNFNNDINKVLAGGGNFNIKGYSDILNGNVSLLSSGVMIGDTGRYWLICGIVPEKTVNASSIMLFWTIIAISIVLIAVTAITILLIVHTYLKKLPPVADAAQKISEGNFDVSVGLNSNNEIADVSNALAGVKKIIQKLVYDISSISEKFKEGDIDARIDEADYKGEFQTVVRKINETFTDTFNDTLVAIIGVTELGNGNFNAPIEEMPGKKELMTTSFKAVQNNLKSFNDDISGVIKGAIDGNLDVSIDVSQYKGDWGKMAAGVNGLIEAVVKPVREAIEVLNQLSGGNLDVSVEGNYKGEFAEMKTALNNTLEMLTSYIKEISVTLTALSQDNLDQSVKREYVGDFSAIKIALNTIIDKYNKVIIEIAFAAEQIAVGTKQISQSSMTLAQGATEQASSVQELNATVSVINENTMENAKNAEKAKILSDRCKDNAAKGDQDMINMLVSISSIKESSQNISKIIKAIDDIAFQTNLLALNAAVEAARAGQHGKGFAVVADEVRSLASKSKQSAKETAALIEESINRVSEGAAIANQTAETLRTILSEVSNVADIVTNIAEDSDEQASAINQVTEGLSQIADVVQDNTGTSEETASASQQLSNQVETLKSLVSVFKLKSN